jgi:hypothetical protein
VGLSRFELLTPRLSSVCSNQLSYRPKPLQSLTTFQRASPSPRLRRVETRSSPARSGRPFDDLSASSRSERRRILSKLDRTCVHSLRAPDRSIFKRLRSMLRLRALSSFGDSRKEVIQPQVLLQLPCYDFTPITNHTLGAYLPCGLARRLLVQPAFVM